MTQRVLRDLSAVFFILLGLVGWRGIQAQQAPAAPPSSGVVVRTTVRNVVVDVVVTDDMGRPVRGLSRENFSVAEDGQPQKILGFDRHDMDTLAATVPPKMPANTFTNLPTQPERGPLYVLLYDMANTKDDDQIFARHQLVQFMNSKPPGTRFMLYAFSDGLHLVEGSTTDKSRLLNALDLEGGRPHMPKVFLYGGQYSRDTFSVLRDVRMNLEGLPGRKNLIWVSGNFPLSIFAPAPREDIELCRRELAMMAAGRIAIYPVDARGVRGRLSLYLREIEIAQQTGGRAYYSTNDLVTALSGATDDGATYYTLSYAPSNQKYDNQLRHIEVQLKKGVYQLSYRRGYYADPEGPREESPDEGPLFGRFKIQPATPPDTLAAYMRRGMPVSHELIFVTRVRPTGSPRLATAAEMAGISDEPAYFSTRQKSHSTKAETPIPLQRYVIDYSVPATQSGLLRDVADTPNETLEFAAGAFDAEGLMLNGTVNYATSAQKGRVRSYMAEQELLVSPGAASICVAVRDVATGRIGNLEIALPLAPEQQAMKP
ncbi:MAG: VWA domain-containing protein [Terracidiphilus sp.]|jgi:VWFA-related protein